MALNEHDLRDQFHRLAAGVSDDPSLAGAALSRGRARLARRHRHRSATLAVTLAVATFASYAVVGGGDAPAAAAVSCFPDRVVARGRVDIGRSGARLTVTNATQSVVRLVAGDVATFVPPGRTAVDVALRPGRVPVSCDTGTPIVTAASITVTDSRGVFVDDNVDCALRDVRDLRGSDAVENGDPVTLTRNRLANLPARAVVEPAGYPDAGDRRVVRVRDGGRVVGVAIWHSMLGPRSWVLDEVHLCDPLALVSLV